MNNRCIKIMDILSGVEHIEIASLAKVLSVSTVTVRKDCNYLESQGLLRKEHGYIMPMAPEDIRFRMTLMYEAKKSIAENAARMVQNGETIMIESGSTCALLASELCDTKRDISVITNSAYIAEYIRPCQGARIIMLGGTYAMETQAVTGPLVKLCANEFFVDKFFSGADGYNKDQGFASQDLLRAEAARAMAERAQNRIILADETKFNKRSVVSLMPATEVSKLITNQVPDDCRQKLEESGVEIILV